MEKVKLPNPCPIKSVSREVPEPLFKYITKKIDRINEILSDPQKYERELKQKEQEFPNIGIFWFDETEELNEFSGVVKVLTKQTMIDLWKKFYSLNQRSLPSLFDFIKNHYYRATNKRQPVFKNKKQSELDKHMLKYCALSANPTELIEKVEELYKLLEEFDELIRPDGADCYEYMDVNAPENKIFGIDGKIPHYVDWDLYITDDEYDTFMGLLYKVGTKLVNRRNKKQSDYQKSVNFLVSPQTRKKGIAKAPEILMIRVLYLRFIELFDKPLNEAISIIISELFHSEYTVNDIVKLTKPIRDRMKNVKNYMKKNGYIRRTDSRDIEDFLYKNL